MQEWCCCFNDGEECHFSDSDSHVLRRAYYAATLPSHWHQLFTEGRLAIEAGHPSSYWAGPVLLNFSWQLTACQTTTMGASEVLNFITTPLPGNFFNEENTNLAKLANMTEKVQELRKMLQAGWRAVANASRKIMEIDSSCWVFVFPTLTII